MCGSLTRYQITEEDRDRKAYSRHKAVALGDAICAEWPGPLQLSIGFSRKPRLIDGDAPRVMIAMQIAADSSLWLADFAPTGRLRK